jgi:curved DNA-binding protein CbpA
MDQKRLKESFDILGISNEASLDELERSFRELHALYSKESLATYSLLEDDDREKKLKSIQDAYNRILRFHRSTANTKEGVENDKSALPIGAQKVHIDADLDKQPGLFLQQLRKAKGLSLRDVARHTKVSSNLLQSIEEQHFDALPVPVYLRGFLRQFAQLVKVPDVEALVDSYMALYISGK